MRKTHRPEDTLGQILALKSKIKEMRAIAKVEQSKVPYCCVLSFKGDDGRSYSVRSAINGSSAYFAAWTIRLTQDNDFILRLTVEEAVRVANELPIPTKIEIVHGVPTPVARRKEIE